MSEEDVKQGIKPGKGRPLIIAAVVIGVIAILVFFYWLIWLRYEDKTDDAYVHGSKVNVTSQIKGYVSSINTDETFLVKEGDVIIELDRTDATIALDHSKAVLANTVRNVTEMFEKVIQLNAQLQRAKTKVIKAQVDYDNRRALVSEGGVSKEDFIHSELNLDAAKYQVTNLRSQLIQAYTAIQGTTVSTHPLVVEAANELTHNFVNLVRCNIRATQTGIVAQRFVQVGQFVEPDENLMAIVPLDQMWVQANFREVDVSQIRIGQRVTVKSDMYGNEAIYSGIVSGIAGGTGAVFSLIPPQNATGNWIKIVQRVPVRIDLDQSEVERFPLRLGLSMYVDIDTKDQYGTRVPTEASSRPVFRTSVYRDQEDGAEALVAKIISENTVDPDLGAPPVQL